MNNTFLLYPALSAWILLCLSGCRSDEPPTETQTVELPAAIIGHAYEAELSLPYPIHIDTNWSVPRNSNFKIEPINEGGAYQRFILRHSGSGFVPDGTYEILHIHGHNGGGSAYRNQRIDLPVAVYAENEPKLAFCTPLRPKKGVLMYDCTRLNRMITESAKDGTFCQKFPQECTLP